MTCLNDFKILFLAVLLLLTPAELFAQKRGGMNSGGGHDAKAEFIEILDRYIPCLNGQTEQELGFEFSQLIEFRNQVILTVKDQLPSVRKNEKPPALLAYINENGLPAVDIAESKWREIPNQKTKDILVLHELARHMKVAGDDENHFFSSPTVDKCTTPEWQIKGPQKFREQFLRNLEVYKAVYRASQGAKESLGDYYAYDSDDSATSAGQLIYMFGAFDKKRFLFYDHGAFYAEISTNDELIRLVNPKSSSYTNILYTPSNGQTVNRITVLNTEPFANAFIENIISHDVLDGKYSKMVQDGTWENYKKALAISSETFTKTAEMKELQEIPPSLYYGLQAATSAHFQSVESRMKHAWEYNVNSEKVGRRWYAENKSKSNLSVIAGSQAIRKSLLKDLVNLQITIAKSNNPEWFKYNDMINALMTEFLKTPFEDIPQKNN